LVRSCKLASYNGSDPATGSSGLEADVVVEALAAMDQATLFGITVPSLALHGAEILVVGARWSRW
jgi:hypothetical protein